MTPSSTACWARVSTLRELSLVQAMRVALVVSVSFLAAWGFWAALGLGLAPPAPLVAFQWLGWAGVAAAGLFVVLSVARPGPLARLPFPPLAAMVAVTGFALLDTLAAGLALWVVLPAELTISPAAILPAYLLALGAGLVLTTPGGVGPFEVAIVTLLPGLPTESLLAAVLAYRTLYFAAPAVIGALMLLRGPLTPPHTAAAPLASIATPAHLPFIVEATLEQAPRAESGLLRHGRLAALQDSAARPVALAALSQQSLIVLSDPLWRHDDRQALLTLITDAARRHLRSPVLYKCGARLAVAARTRGWKVTPVAHEAVLAPARFTANGPACRQLRRKLRKAENAGVHIEVFAPGDALPLDALTTVARDWAQRNGGERRFSMGVCDQKALRWSEVLVARTPDDAVCAFISLHTNRNERTLDLIRSASNAPDGTIHLLVRHAIEHAAQAGIPRLSLAAVPLSPREHRPAPLRAAIWHRSGGAGLRQFKASFAPRWEPLYICAPTRIALALGVLDLLREIAPARHKPDSSSS